MQRPSIVAYFAPYFEDELVLMGHGVEGTSHNGFQEIYMLPFSGDTLSIIWERLPLPMVG